MMVGGYRSNRAMRRSEGKTMENTQNTLTLDVKARSNSGNDLDVTIVDTGSEWGPTLRIQYAGGWYLQTLMMREVTDALWIDHGSNWVAQSLADIKQR